MIYIIFSLNSISINYLFIIDFYFHRNCFPFLGGNTYGFSKSSVQIKIVSGFRLRLFEKSDGHRDGQKKKKELFPTISQFRFSNNVVDLVKYFFYFFFGYFTTTGSATVCWVFFFGNWLILIGRICLVFFVFIALGVFIRVELDNLFKALTVR